MTVIISGQIFDIKKCFSGIFLSPVRTHTDQEEDVSTGLYNYDARLYDPVLGQFVMADTIVPDLYDPQMLNRYSYVRNNPLIYVDPDGHVPVMGDNKDEIDTHYQGPDKSDYYKDVDRETYRHEEYTYDTNGSARNKITRTEWDIKNGFQERMPTHQAIGIYAGSIYGSIIAGTVIEGVPGAYGLIKSWFKSKFGKNVKCFVPGTLVLMADGTTCPIEEVEPNDWVIGDNPEDSLPANKYQVTSIIKSFTERIVRITIDDGDGIPEGEIESTGKHPYWTENRDWQYAENLEIGDVLLDDSSGYSFIVDIEIEYKESPTYNLTVDEVQTYFVVSGDKSVLVHNVDPFRFNSGTGRWHGPNGRFTSPPTADQMRQMGKTNGWTKTHVTNAGFETWSDSKGQKRMKIKPASTQQGLKPNSKRPRVTIWNQNGQRVDGFGNPVRKKSLTAHAPLENCP